MNSFLEKLFIYLRLQLKNAFLVVPKVFLIFIIFGGLFLSIGIYGNRIISQNAETEKLSIALVIPQEDKFSSFAFSFLNRMQSVKELLEFIPMEREDAFQNLKNQKVFAIIEIPDLFIEGILDGSNVPAKVFLSSNHSLENILFRTLLNAGVSVLGTAQAGIYTADDILFSHQMFDSVTEMEEALNKIYLSYVLERDTYFKQKEIGLTDNLSVFQFYASSFFLLLVLYSGMAVCDFFKETASFQQSIKREGLGFFWNQTIKIFSLSFCYWIFLIGCFQIASLFPRIKIYIPNISIPFCLIFFLFLFSINSFFFLLYQMSKKANNYILLLCILSTVFLFCSGGIIPKQLLPNLIQKIGTFLPSTFWLNTLKKILLNKITPATIFSCFIFSCCFFSLSFLLELFSSHILKFIRKEL